MNPPRTSDYEKELVNPTDEQLRSSLDAAARATGLPASLARGLQDVLVPQEAGTTHWYDAKAANKPIAMGTERPVIPIVAFAWFTDRTGRIHARVISGRIHGGRAYARGGVQEPVAVDFFARRAGWAAVYPWRARRLHELRTARINRIKARIGKPTCEEPFGADMLLASGPNGALIGKRTDSSGPMCFMLRDQTQGRRPRLVESHSAILRVRKALQMKAPEERWNQCLRAFLDVQDPDWTSDDLVTAATTQVSPYTSRSERLDATDWRDVFSKSERPDHYYVKGSRSRFREGDPLWRAVIAQCRVLSIQHRECGSWSRVSNCHSFTREYAILDGGVVSEEGTAWGTKGMWVVGLPTLRLLCYELGVMQPRRQRGESHIASHEELTNENSRRQTETSPEDALAEFQRRRRCKVPCRCPPGISSAGI